MANINKITVNGTTYDIEDSTARSGTGLTNDIKQALLDCFEHVAWTDANGQTYYDALEEALYPPANLTNITCTYTQSGTVYTTDSLDSLRSNLVVIAHYDNNTTATVTSYTLTGTLSAGTSTVTVTHSGKTTTFTVNVTQAYAITNNLTNCTSSNDATTIGSGSSYSATLTETSGYELSSVTVTMGGTDVTSTVYSNGTITIASVSGDIVITAIALAGALYKLSAPITFDGTVSPINTNVILQPSGATDVDWTIAFEFVDSSGMNTSSCIFDFGYSSNYSLRFAYFQYNASRNRWMAQMAGSGQGAWVSASFGETERWVVSHTQGSDTVMVYQKRGTNEIETAEVSKSYNQPVRTNAQSVGILLGGGYDSGNVVSSTTQASGVTVNNFRIYNEVWDSDTINDFLTNGVN